MRYKVYKAIIKKAIKDGRLIEPFTKPDFQMCYPGLGDGTYNTFLHKHAKEKPGGSSELFERVGADQFW